MRNVARMGLVMILSCALYVGALLGAGVPDAHGAPEYAAAIEFSGVTANVEGVTLTGTATSTGTGMLYEVQVVMWVSPDPITDSESLDAHLASLTEDAAIVPTAGATTIVVSGDAAFEPGQTSSFTVAATWAELGLTASAVYVVGVDVQACDEPGSPLVSIGSGRTLATLATTTTPSPADPPPSPAGTPPSTVVMLTSTPSLIHDDVFLDDHLAQELTGRLRTLLALAHRPGITWVIDPALYHEIATMADGYSVLSNGGTPTDAVDGEGSADATAWLRSFASLPTSWGYRLPWANPDLGLGAALADPHMRATAQGALEAAEDQASSQDEASAIAQIADLPLLVSTPDGMVDDSFLTYVGELGPQTILAHTSTNALAEDIRIMATRAQAYPEAVGLTDSTSDVQRVQRALAEDLLDTGAIRVITSAEDATLAEKVTAPWLRPTTLSGIEVTTDWTTDSSPGTPASTMTPEVLATIHAARDALADFSVLTDGAKETQPAGAIALAAGSSLSWPSPTAALTYLGAARAWIDSLFDPITLTATVEVSLTSRVSSFPVTVTNGLSVPISVRILTGTTPVGRSPANVSIPLTDLHVIQPGDKLTLSLTPTIVREGDVDAVLQLTTTNGSPIADPVTVRIHATMSAWMGWVVVGGAFILFIVGTFLRVRSARKKRGANRG